MHLQSPAPTESTFSIVGFDAHGNRLTYWTCPFCWWEWREITEGELNVKSNAPTQHRCPACNTESPYVYEEWRSGDATAREAEIQANWTNTKHDPVGISRAETGSSSEDGPYIDRDGGNAGRPVASEENPGVLDERPIGDSVADCSGEQQ